MFKKLLKKIIPMDVINRLKLLLVYLPFERGSRDNGNILSIYNFNQKKFDNIAIFSHFDRDHIIDDYVLYYLKNIKEIGFDIVFVSTAQNLTKSEVDKVKDLCIDVIVKENRGYDFGAWKSGLEHLDNQLYSYDKLLLCNDSVYAPLYPLDQIFDKMQQYDFWGITDSYEISYHIQSYFMVFDKNIFMSEIFKKFWRRYKVYKIKRNIILHYEIGISKKFIKNRYKIGSYCRYEDIKTELIRNPTHYFWKSLIIDLKSPILKIELLRDNPQNIDISDWKEVLKKYSNYDLSFIQNHLSRVKSF